MGVLGSKAWKSYTRPLSVLWVVLCTLLVTGAAVAGSPKLSRDGSQATSKSSDEKRESKKQRKAAARKRADRKRRGGINPCMTPDPGFGIYDNWSTVGVGRLLAPQRGGVTSKGGFDLIVHFHGRYPIRKEFVREAKGTVLVGVDLGVSSAPYTRAFSNPGAFERLLDNVKAEMARRTGKKKTYIRKLALSSWSAGYGAIEQILRQKAGKKVDALILLDSVHTGYDDPKKKTLRQSGLEPFIKFAKQAARGRGLMYQTHSSIIPPGYASTREVSHAIVKAVGGKVRKSKRGDRYGLELFERYDKRGYKVRGYRGNDKPDHCAHLGLMRDVMRVLINPRWKSPRGRKGKRAVTKAKATARKSGNLYVVKKGDSLGKIANRHGIKVSELREANGLAKGSDPIQPGDELVIPESATKKKRSSKPKSGKVYVVRKGDSLGKIANRHGIKVSALREANDLDKGSPPIRPGDELIIPDGGKKTKKRGSTPKGKKAGPGEKTHTVAKGQTLGAIAKRYHVTVDAIRERNDFSRKQRIQPGQKLIIPKRKK